MPNKGPGIALSLLNLCSISGLSLPGRGHFLVRWAQIEARLLPSSFSCNSWVFDVSVPVCAPIWPGCTRRLSPCPGPLPAPLPHWDTGVSGVSGPLRGGPGSRYKDTCTCTYHVTVPVLIAVPVHTPVFIPAPVCTYTHTYLYPYGWFHPG